MHTSRTNTETQAIALRNAIRSGKLDGRRFDATSTKVCSRCRTTLQGDVVLCICFHDFVSEATSGALDERALVNEDPEAQAALARSIESVFGPRYITWGGLCAVVFGGLGLLAGVLGLGSHGLFGGAWGCGGGALAGALLGVVLAHLNHREDAKRDEEYELTYWTRSGGFDEFSWTERIDWRTLLMTRKHSDPELESCVVYQLRRRAELWESAPTRDSLPTLRAQAERITLDHDLRAELERDLLEWPLWRASDPMTSAAWDAAYQRFLHGPTARQVPPAPPTPYYRDLRAERATRAASSRGGAS